MNKEVGALISLQPNATKIAHKLGLDTFFQNKRPTIDTAFRIYNSDGAVTNTIDLLKAAGPSGARVCYHRVDLHESLKQAATDDDGETPPAQIRIASRVCSCNAEEGSVLLESGEVLSADLIVGADGIHSVCRDSIFFPTENPTTFSPKSTGVSAYRLLLPTSRILSIPNIRDHLDPTAPMTHMLFGHEQRVIMGPARQGEIFGITALVPDGKMYETSSTSSWTSEGSLNKLLESFNVFPQWLKDIFAAAAAPDEAGNPSDVALWQLRDIDPLPRWSRGRLILVGDAAHAMLPTQGQGASQSFEDAEALGEFVNDINLSTSSFAPSKSVIEALGERFFSCRYERASLIQGYSRQQGQKSGQEGNRKDLRVTLNPAEFMKYNITYEGAREWEKLQKGAVQQAVC
jgi:salicylate hydroxylase